MRFYKLIDMRVAVLGAWMLVQPWFCWPHLFPDVSHRLTLVVCSVLLGLLTLGYRRLHEPLPIEWTVAFMLLLLVMICHQAEIIRDGVYFEFFQETTLFCDGLLVLIAGFLGLWGLRQVPLTWFRRLRWVGLLWLTMNLCVVISQEFHSSGSSFLLRPTSGSLVGMLGMDRFLGASAVAWMPIVMTIHPLLFVIPLALVAASQKVTAWVGVAVVGWVLYRPFRWLVLLTLPVVVWFWTEGVLWVKVWQRLRTWKHLFLATGLHPWVGWGFSPFAESKALQGYGYLLPGLHSDWLSLAFHAGWIVVLSVLWVWGKIVVSSPMSSWEQAIRASITAMGAMASGQSSVSHARIMGVVMVVSVWWLVERASREKECQA